MIITAKLQFTGVKQRFSIFPDHRQARRREEERPWGEFGLALAETLGGQFFLYEVSSGQAV